MFSHDNKAAPEKQQTQEDNAQLDSKLGNKKSEFVNDDMMDGFVLVKQHSRSMRTKNEINASKPKLNHSSFSESSVSSNLGNFKHESMMRLSRLFKGKKYGDMDPAVAHFEELRFEVTKINKRGKEQKRAVVLSAHGICNIRPPNKISSLERWSDVLLCYKLDELTVAIKYTNSERRYRAESKKIAENLVNSVRVRVNAHQELSRKLLKKRMIEGFDEKEKDEAVPVLKEEESKHADEDEIRMYVEQILLSDKSKVFDIKQRICNFALMDLEGVKKLRKYLNQFKSKILEEYRPELSAKIDLTNSEVHKYIRKVIESVIESACLPSHLEVIYKVLSEEHKSPDIFIPKIRLLSEKPQEFFGINKKLRSKDKWLNAVTELVNFPKKVLPSAKMQCLLKTAAHIHQEAKRNYKKEITGDDLLPIVIFVLVKASWRYKKIIITHVDQQFIDILINPDTLQGERGYYLCVFSAALEFIRTYDKKKIEERFNTIKRLKDFGFF